MKVLIVFETVEGQTRKVVDFLAKQLRSAGHDLQLLNTEDRLRSLSFNGFDRAVLAAPVHERRHPKNFEAFVSANRSELKVRPTLLISVSLKAAFPEGLEEAQDYVTEMEMRTGFEPSREVLVAGAVRTSSYGYYERQIVQNVALAGHDIELTEGEREFTDWKALGSELEAFLAAKL
ncbi:MAG: flavodoxin domain-containing protein [Pseudorhodobacter sp.]